MGSVSFHAHYSSDGRLQNLEWFDFFQVDNLRLIRYNETVESEWEKNTRRVDVMSTEFDGKKSIITPEGVWHSKVSQYPYRSFRKN